MRASELQAKDVINVTDGRRLGVIGDLDIDLDSGIVRSVIVPPAGRFFGLMPGGDEVVIGWNQIVKIGLDVVLVDMRSPGDSPLLPVERTSRSSLGY
ncbi:MAG: YlmC/YmxH family sporulation protein [Firmicutes bacterium]|nr:YlmC/YmxH family sporulation protein [Bacillota bacterium]